MEKRRSRLRLAVILAAVAGIAIYGLGFQSIEVRATVTDQDQAAQFRADIIEIDSMNVFGELEKPPVTFLHDLHTDTLDKNNKDCTTCHPKENVVYSPALKENDGYSPLSKEDIRLSPRFKRTLSAENMSQKDLMDLYHSNCLGCHRDMAGAGLKAGPVEECGYCHVSAPPSRSIRQPFGLDKSLHFRHVKELANQCEQCHHAYDEEKKALVYVKDKEGSCRYCHGLETVDNRIPMQLASHLACIGCHKKTRSQQLTAGPINCTGCHDPRRQEMIQEVSPVPRMDRKQPDIVYVKIENKDPYMNLDTYLDPKMARVPFDHKAHESTSESCRSCHHTDLVSCNSCHTLAGSEKGANITLEQAMHQRDSEHSCIGCHEIRKQAAQCAGCHILQSGNRPGKDAACIKCHNGPSPEEMPTTPAASTALVASGKTPAATVALSPVTLSAGFRESDIPEKVVIKALTSAYAAVDLPHRKIIDSIWGRIRDNRLAGTFHGDKDTLCKGCHHNSPRLAKPPRCGSCHGKPFDENDLFKPGLMAAYHRQCMGCHTEMKIEKPVAVNCTGCHEKREG